MKKDIHPEYMECTVRCSCGNTFKTRSTKPELRVELCNECHPFFTGQQKFVDTGGRVQRFSDKFGSASAATLEREAKKKAERAAKAAEKAKRAAEYAAKAKSEESKPAEDQAARPASDEGAAEPEAVADAPAPEAASAE